MPILLTGISIERVDAVVGGRYKHDVVCATTDIDVCHVQRLSVNLIVDGQLKQQAKLVTVHVGRVQRGLVCIQAVAVIVVVLGEYARLSVRELRV